MKSKIIPILILLLFFKISYAQIPVGYYDNANGLTGAALKTALYNIIKGHTDMGYGGLYSCYTTTDNLPGNNVYDMYSVRADSTANYWYINSSNSANQCGSYNSEADCYNREHSFCDSWLGASSPQRSDLFHVYPTDGYVNNRRSSYPHGKVGTATWTSTNGSKLGSSDPATGYSGIVFEPIDEFKGDFARSYFYVATRYENLIANWVNNGSANQILAGNIYPAYKTWFLNLMIQWHTQDAVSEKEIRRNNAVYAYQHNRNPFIDHPEYVANIWNPNTGGALPEPTNYPTNFSSHNLKLNWTEATGATLPDGYLIRISSVSFNDIQIPIDGISVQNSNTDKNVPYGLGEVWFNNLLPNTTYYVKIFAYTGSDTSINYKTDGVISQLQVNTAP